MRRNKKQYGFTFLELLGALTIMMVAIAAILGVYHVAQSQNTTNTLTRNIQTLQSLAKGIFTIQGTYGTTGTNIASTLYNQKKIPDDLTYSSSSGVLSTATNNTIQIMSYASYFTITVTNLDATSCVDLVASQRSGWSSVSINGSSISSSSFPVSIATAEGSSYCGGTSPFTVIWTSSN